MIMNHKSFVELCIKEVELIARYNSIRNKINEPACCRLYKDFNRIWDKFIEYLVKRDLNGLERATYAMEAILSELVFRINVKDMEGGAKNRLD